jgi:uncharacterized protein (DUF2126 family)/transglutaminase-like putative cysteine protease
MPIHVALQHKTQYTYDRPVGHGPHVVRLRPAPHCRTRVLSYSQRIVGGEHFINWQQDPFSNWNARLTFPDRMKELAVEVELVVEMAVYNPFDFFLEESAVHYPFAYESGLERNLAPFLERGALTPRLEALLRTVRQEWLGPLDGLRAGHPEAFPPVPALESLSRLDVRHGGGQRVVDPFDKLRVNPEVEAALAVAAPVMRADGQPQREPLRTIDLLVALNQRLQRDVRYLIRLEPGVQPPEETLRLGSGSCRDSAWLLVQLLRHLRLAARFASGYLIQLAPDQKALDGPSGPEQDFTDLHAWCEVYLPGAGWIGLDPTSGLLAGEGHIPLSCTPEPTTSAPVTGAVDECKAELHHEMRVARVHESPRVTKPYTEEQWARLDALGHAIDQQLATDDVRLTMGGEPTFVSVDDPDGPEWNFTAISPRKRALSGELIKRLRSRLAPGALLHYGQGKWYPGEPLPRWALGAYWRKDGVGLWHDDELIADETKDYGFGAKEAKMLADRIAAKLGVGCKWILPGYEDAFYYTWKERRLPSNVTPEKSNLKDPLERARLARLFQQGLGEIVGYALPLGRGDAGWMSGPWFLRDEETLWLLPGDSPMGLRLPLDSIPWVAERDKPWLHAQDPSAAYPPLPRELPRQRFVAANAERAFRDLSAPGGEGTGRERGAQAGHRPGSTVTAGTERRPATGESAPWLVRAALCVEPRDGRLHVFMPPVAVTEDYLDLVAAVESSVTELSWPVILEGEPPPRDPRLERLAVTPDPGVIEVNLHPSQSWADLVERTEVLYEEARATRLGTEKFMLDGRHTGTGGGNHIILGGATTADSPLLRRPDLLRSLLGYWQNHPSLSWLFSGMFIGPTSQAPRVDEARHDSLYELEVAFRELERQMGMLPRSDGAALSAAVSANGNAWVPPWLLDRAFRNLLVDATGNTHRAEFSLDKLYPAESARGRLGLLEMRAFEMPPHPRMSLAQHLLLRGLLAKFWREPYRNELVRWGTDMHDRWMLPHFCETDFREVLGELGEAGFPFEFGWFAPHFEFRFPRLGEFVQRDVNVELRVALEPWHVLGEEPGAGGTVRYVDSSLERLQVKARGLAGDRFVLACNGRVVPLHPTGRNGEAVAGVRYRAWQPPECLQPTIGVHAPLRFDLYDTWNERSLGGCTYHVAHPGGRSYATFPVNAYEAESRRLARFFTHGATQGRFQPPREPGSREFPFTLDLRREAERG